MGLFHEQVISVQFTILGIGVMLTGFAGMTYFSSPKKQHYPVETLVGETNHVGEANHDGDHGQETTVQVDMMGQQQQHDLELQQSNISSITSLTTNTLEMNPQDLNEPLLLHHTTTPKHDDIQHDDDDDDDFVPQDIPSTASDVTDIIKNGKDDDDNLEYISFDDEYVSFQQELNSSHYSQEEEQQHSNGHSNGQHASQGQGRINSNFENNQDQYIELFGRQWNRRIVGILAAASDGVLGGGNLIPMHYSK